MIVAVMETGIIVIVFALLVFTWIYAPDIVWRVSSFNAFRLAVTAVEESTITAVVGMSFTPPINIRSLGERRLSEVIQGSFDPNFNLRVVRCYGAIFLKDETIEETIKRIRTSCFFVLLGLIVGGGVAALDEAFMNELALKATIEWLPLLFHRLRSYDFVMVTELASLVFLVVSLADAGSTLKKLRTEF